MRGTALPSRGTGRGTAGPARRATGRTAGGVRISLCGRARACSRRCSGRRCRGTFGKEGGEERGGGVLIQRNFG